MGRQAIEIIEVEFERLQGQRDVAETAAGCPLADLAELPAQHPTKMISIMSRAIGASPNNLASPLVRAMSPLRKIEEV